MGAAVLLVGGQRVEREQGRHDPHRFAFAERVRELEQAHFGLGIEAVAGLDLDRGAAAGHQRVETAAALVEQLLVRRGGGALDRRGDPAAGLGDLFIGRAGAAHRMLVGARAAEHQVGVAIDQPRRDPGAAERVDLLCAIAGKLGALADADDAAAVDPDRAILDQAKRIARPVLQAGDVAVDEQPVPHARRLRRGELLRSKHGGVAQSFRAGFERSPGRAGRAGRGAARRRIGDSGAL